ncbi:hypothetical protein [Mesorhizobium sp. B4-1-4]|uniref:hypothetical protein n=1 Tax=Mesorhizobium sp. B4-1-4 TaxID=2589888 RepID=UPI0011266F2C|nr:hypothetical protein [Mesorhizobium sp. B4-1-4]UCI31900.1 hypothetical protein FJW03_29915 [Mesorhizobium sp. B4-1-4]
MAIDHERDLGLAREFWQNPFSIHSPALAALMRELRREDPANRHFLLLVDPGRKWMLARTDSHSATGFSFYEDKLFDSPEEAEWEIFRLRWKRITGRELPLSFERGANQ